MASLRSKLTHEIFNHFHRPKYTRILSKSSSRFISNFSFDKKSFSTCPSSNPSFVSDEKSAKELSEEFPQAKTLFQKVINDAFLILNSPHVKPDVTIKQTSDESTNNQNVWITRISMKWPEKYDIEGIACRKSDSEKMAYLYACQKLKEWGTLDEKNNPILPNHLTFDEKMMKNAKAELNSIYQIIWRKFGNEKLRPQYKSDQVSALVGNIPLWRSSLTLSYPLHKVFEGYSHRLGDADKVASAKALQWLQETGVINKKRQPVLYTREEERKMYSDQKLPYPLILSEDLQSQMETVLGQYKNLKEVYKELYSNVVDAEDNMPETLESLVEEPTINMFNEMPYEELSESELEKRSQALLNHQVQSELSYHPKLQSFFNTRINLPIFSKRDEILKIINENQVMVLSGETGCGKSTQVPQYIFESYIEKNKGAECNVIVAQPRRISAISIAEYVASERNEEVGSSVGYQVRLHKKLPQGHGSILFCTTGMLLRKMCFNPNLDGVSHIIVDEVHEESIHVDFLLILLQNLLLSNRKLKVILMSASFNTSLFSNYFNKCPVLHIPGRLYPVTEYFLNDLPENIVGNHKTDPRYFNLDLVTRVIRHVHDTQPRGAILCFLPGWHEIVSLWTHLEQLLSDKGEYVIYPLHSKLLPEEQMRVFANPPPNVRKIILSTNVAETSVTIEDVVYVIDTGLHKGTKFDSANAISSLMTSWITKASVRQRRGRAGRTQPGICYHLFPRRIFAEMDDYPEAEILRHPLEKVVLDCKIHCPEMKAEDFLSMAMHPPSRSAIQQGVKDLYVLGILDENENLTKLGKILVYFGSHPRFSKALIYATFFKCLDPVLTICALYTLSQEPFTGILDKNSEIKKVKEEHDYSLLSDHLALYNIYCRWDSIEEDEARDEFVKKNSLDGDSLVLAKQLKSLFLENLVNAKFLPDAVSCDDYSCNRDCVPLVLSILASVFYPNVVKLVQGEIKGGRLNKEAIVYQTLRNQNAMIQAESIASKEYELPSPFLVYFNAMKSEAKQMLLVSSTSSIHGLSLLLFAGQKLTQMQYQDGCKLGSEVVTIDNFSQLSFCSIEGSMPLLCEFRQLLEELFQVYLRQSNKKLCISDRNMNEFCQFSVIPLLKELFNITEVPFIPGKKIEFVDGRLLCSEL